MLAVATSECSARGSVLKASLRRSLFDGLSRLNLSQRLDDAVGRQLHEHRDPKRWAVSKCE